MKNFPVRLIVASALLIVSPLAVRADAPPVTGIPNFHQVTERIYRGAQPETEAWSQLSKLGVKTVVDLRQRGEHSIAAESTAVATAGMRYINFPMDGFATPTSAQMTTVLAMLDGPDGVFVHCKKGCDRTGTVIAAYRISRQKWENPKALTEAKTCGMHWFEAGMRRFISGYSAPSAVASAAASAGKAPTTKGAAQVAATQLVGERDSTGAVQSEATAR